MPRHLHMDRYDDSKTTHPKVQSLSQPLPPEHHKSPDVVEACLLSYTSAELFNSHNTCGHICLKSCSVK